MKIKRLIVIAVATITIYQVFSTISIFKGDGNIHMIYEVKQGESLKTVASKFDTSIEKLQRLNNLSGAYVEPGTRLKVE